MPSIVPELVKLPDTLVVFLLVKVAPVLFVKLPDVILPSLVKLPLFMTSAIIEPLALFVKVPPTVNES